MHEIDGDSPLLGETQQSMIDGNLEIIVSLVGTDDTLNQTVHARFSYLGSDILWWHRYADIVGIDDQARRVVDYRKFHDTVAATLERRLEMRSKRDVTKARRVAVGASLRPTQRTSQQARQATP